MALHLYTNDTRTEWVIAESIEDANMVMREHCATYTPEDRDLQFGAESIDEIMARDPIIEQWPDDKVFGYRDVTVTPSKLIKRLPPNWAKKCGRGHLVSVEE